MDTDVVALYVVALYCLTDDLLRAKGHAEPPQRSMTDSEVITTALVATRLFGGNFATARAYLRKEGSARRATFRTCSPKANTTGGSTERSTEQLLFCDGSSGKWPGFTSRKPRRTST